MVAQFADDISRHFRQRSHRTETGSVMIDVLSMGIVRPSYGIHSQRHADANGEIHA